MSNTHQQKSLQLYIRLQTYAFRYKSYFILSILGFFAFAASQGLFMKVTEFFIAGLQNSDDSEVFSYFPESYTASVLFAPVAIILVSFIYGIGAFVGNFYMGKLGLSVVNQLRKDVFSHMVYLPQAHYDKHNSGELVSLIIYNIEQVTAAVTNACKILLRDGLTLIVLIGVLLHYSWQLTLIFFLITPILAGLVYLAGRYFRRASKRIQRTVGKITHISTESLQGIKLVKSYSGEEYECKRFEKAADESLDYGVRFERVRAIQTPTLHIVVASALAVIFLLISLFWEGTSAAAVVYVTAAAFLSKPFRQLSNLVAVIQKGLAAAESIFHIIDMPGEENNGKEILKSVKGHLEFKDLYFSYKGEKPAINNLSFSAKPGETIALVGGSGSGKTTLTHLLLRLYRCSSGEISIDGKNITELELGNLRSHIALVNQQTTLFNDSIKANIAYSEEHYDMQRIETAARLANAHEFICEQEFGYDTPAGEDGSLLSGGQRQRIAIARALYKNAPILILDEATSALDNDAEKQIQQALESLKKDRTTLIIAHRLSTIENADQILVMREGEIVERGTHQSLLKKSGYYASLYKSSFESSSETNSNTATIE